MTASPRRDAASERQVQAADPAASTWLSANAGSGKTRVLTDRVARLLLGGTQPQRILCLTYTKAAATEMQNRLFRRLGGWAMLDEPLLRAELAALGVDEAITPDTLARARRLFARAIETPGGLKIQTIHSFCASLLRRFPLEAGVSPGFTEMDERTGQLLRADIVEDLADGHAADAMERLAAGYTGEDFGRLAEEVTRNAARFDPPLTRDGALAAFGLSPDMTAEALLAEVFLGGEAEWLAEVAQAMAAGTVTDAKQAAVLAALPLQAPDLSTLAALEGLLLTGKGAKEPFTAKIGSFPTKTTRAALGALNMRLEALMLRVEAARPRRQGLAAAERAAVLHQFAALFLPEYARRKAARGWLDFDDLIRRARMLLTDPSVAQWVLFRLDGGIDHILVDEAQDTGPDQWKVIERLAQEFTAGQGARDTPRTIFVVGDKKQSIYSFQGADLRAFDAMQRHFDAELARVGQPLGDLTLEYSFRSSAAVLRAVDLTFDDRAGRGLGGAVRHIAFHDALPGRVDLWPPVQPAEDPDPEDWTSPVDLPGPRHHNVELADRIATEIARLIAAGTRVPLAQGARAVRAGDFLVLVQRRSALFHEIIRACKAAGLPIAGADRLRLGGIMAVRDLSALLAFLATPEDDLSLAAALRSPLFGWTEAELYALAQPRRGFLWEALRDQAGAHAPTLAMLTDLRDQTGFLRPYELIDRILTRHGGRHRLVARLGTEAEDGIDQLLTQALAYERVEVPSLMGFLGRLQADDIEVKRQPDAAGNRIRVMTVHGAKGLEAPVVILPDTADRKPPDTGEVLVLDDGTPVWRTPADDSPPRIAAARADLRARWQEENLRLLYVAMTRAESWLIVAAAGKVEKGTGWHDIVTAGLTAAGAVAETFPTGAGLRLQHGVWPDNEAVPPEPTAAAGPPALPDWATQPAAVPPRPPRPLSPSDLGGAKALPGEVTALTEDDARRRGTLLHLLLEHLAGRAPADRAALAATLLGGDPLGAGLAEEAAQVLDDPALAALFGTGTMAEVPVHADLAGRRMLGKIDRLVIGPDRVLAVDFKSNAVIPDRPDRVPEGLLRQMAAYRIALAQVWPDRCIDAAILWTRAPRLMPLPPDLLDAAVARLDVASLQS